MENVGFAAWIFRGRVAATPRLQRGYSEGRYLGRAETDCYRCYSMELLGGALRLSKPEDSLSVLKKVLALRRRFFHPIKGVLELQTNIAGCLSELGRSDEALVLFREIYKKSAVAFGVSHEVTLVNGSNLVTLMHRASLFDETRHFLRDQLLPEARRSLGADHDVTLKIRQCLSATLFENPNGTRDEPRLNQDARGVDATWL